ncbi:class II fructose-bisphosphate aldolase [Anaerosalibacter massiliensis]|uniref:Class II fructose-bisphosphate aldolase n=1 Tax=Anaerosalibacter massiliensis TaxID=1347392 RepID=A0A9X2MHQ7_9FIRM|nr:class II fructose-bisphosphate aldolase [Anaerosalibacter massiliensis]MCR2045352.1 class II fructose-bisphosphate aldolase [Anaerosalibacter massiliensis]
MLQPMTEILKNAKKGGYAIAQPDFLNITMAAMYLEAARRLKAPIILGYGEEYIANSEAKNLKHLVKIIESLVEEYNIPVTLHLDHGQSFEICSKAIDAGFNSVMFDGSSLPFEENVAITKKVVEIAKPAGVSVEAELGYVGTADDINDDSKLTDPKMAKNFVKETNVDALAVSIGTVHGQYKGKPNIRLDLLSEINESVDIPLVLHGASGTGHEIIAECVKRGICKVNIYTDLVNVMEGSLRNDMKNFNSDLVSVTNNIRESVIQELETYIKTLGSENMI